MQELEEGGHFIVASDGVWEFLSNEDVAQIVHRARAQGMARECVVREVARAARGKWKAWFHVLLRHVERQDRELFSLFRRKKMTIATTSL